MPLVSRRAPCLAWGGGCRQCVGRACLFYLGLCLWQIKDDWKTFQWMNKQTNQQGNLEKMGWHLMSANYQAVQERKGITGWGITRVYKSSEARREMVCLKILISLKTGGMLRMERKYFYFCFVSCLIFKIFLLNKTWKIKFSYPFKHFIAI